MTGATNAKKDEVFFCSPRELQGWVGHRFPPHTKIERKTRGELTTKKKQKTDKNVQ